MEKLELRGVGAIRARFLPVALCQFSTIIPFHLGTGDRVQPTACGRRDPANREERPGGGEWGASAVCV